MVISSDVQLKGTAWNVAVTSLENIFKTRTNYSIFLLSTAIGIMYDQQIVDPEEKEEEISYVPRTVLYQYIEDLDFLFQSAILTTKTEDFSEEERLSLAFGDEKKSNFERMKFLLKFANFGVTKLVGQIGSDTLETMENIKEFLASSMEGSNFDIYSINDDDLKIDETELS
jgi:hypothetical protein